MKSRFPIINSIVFRTTMLFAIIIVFAVFLGGYLVFQISFDLIISDSEKELQHKNQLISTSFTSIVEEAKNDISILASSQIIKNFIENSGNDNLENVNSLFSQTITHKPNYFQIRLIEYPVGKEVVRFEKRQNTIVVTPKNFLQSKGNKSYYLNSIKLSEGEHYVSSLNLNEEHGEISEPHTPTLRLAQPIFDDRGVLYGIVVINVSLVNLYNQLDDMYSDKYSTYLYRENGELIYHPENDSLEFTFQKEIKHLIQDELKPIKKNTETSLEEYQKSVQTLYATSDTLSYGNEGETLVILSAVEESVIQKFTTDLRKKAVVWLSIVILSSLLLVLVFGLYLSRRINRITRAISDYEKGRDIELDSPESLSDEIAVLTQGFLSMKGTIDQQIEDLSLALQKARKAEKERDEFLQNMSHELRTPLSAITALTENLKKNKLPEKFHPVTESISRNVRVLSALVYDVLDYKKLKDGEVTLTNKNTDLNHLVKSICRTYEFDAIKKGINFKIDIHPDLSNHLFLIDELRLSQVITNLVVNAIKFTEKGKIELDISYDDSNELVKIDINDTGKGMEPEIIQSFFKNEFDKISPSQVNDSYGLGLAIVKQLIKLFEAKIEIQSDLGNGTKIHLEIPAQKVQKNSPQVNYDMSQEITIQVVLIEDDPVQAEYIKSILNYNWISLKIFNDFEDAKVHLVNQPSDLILSDLNLERHSITKELHDLYVELTIPLWIISGDTRPILFEKEVKHFIKPVDSDLLQAELFLFSAEKVWHSPKIENLKEKYDYNAERIQKVIRLLIEELKKYERSIDSLISKYEVDVWDAFVHKIKVHAKELELKELETIMELESTQVSENHLDKVLNLLQFYRLALKRNLNDFINSKD